MSNVRFSPEELRSRSSSVGVTLPESVIGLVGNFPQFSGMALAETMFMKQGKQGVLAKSLDKMKETDPKAYAGFTGISPQEKVSQLVQAKPKKPRQTFGDATITRRSLLG